VGWNWKHSLGKLGSKILTVNKLLTELLVEGLRACSAMEMVGMGMGMGKD